MGKPSTPSPPDPVATANAQATANVNTAAAQAALNYVNQKTPYGSTTYTQTGSYTTPSGETVPTYSEDVQLSPLGQSILGGQQNVVNTLLPGAEKLAGTAANSINQPLNFNTAFSPTLNSSPQALSKTAADAIYGEQAGFLNPQWTQQQRDLEDQLSRQGIPVGSEAYNNAMTNFNNSKTQAYQAAADSATGAGTQAASQLFNMALAGQQQNVAQQQLAQSEPLSLLQSLFGAAPTTPSQPITQPSSIPVGQTDVIGATGLSTQAAQNAYQARLAQQNAMFGGLSSLGSAALLAFL